MEQPRQQRLKALCAELKSLQALQDDLTSRIERELAGEGERDSTASPQPATGHTDNYTSNGVATQRSRKQAKRGVSDLSSEPVADGCDIERWVVGPPEDAFAHILSMLPFPSIASVRGTCRAWHDAVRRCLPALDLRRWPPPRADLRAMFPSLQRIDLRRLPAHPCGIGKLSDMLDNLSGMRLLRSLTLGSLHLCGSRAALAQGVSWYSNRLGQPGLQSRSERELAPQVPEALSTLTALNHLTIATQGHRGSGAVLRNAQLHVPPSLKHLSLVEVPLELLWINAGALQGLTRMDVRGLGTTNGHSFRFPPGDQAQGGPDMARLTAFTNLQELEITHARLRQLPSQLSALVRLRSLRVSSNYIQDWSALQQLSSQLTALTLLDGAMNGSLPTRTAGGGWMLDQADQMAQQVMNAAMGLIEQQQHQQPPAAGVAGAVGGGAAAPGAAPEAAGAAEQAGGAPAVAAAAGGGVVVHAPHGEAAAGLFAQALGGFGQPPAAAAAPAEPGMPAQPQQQGGGPVPVHLPGAAAVHGAGAQPVMMFNGLQPMQLLGMAGPQLMQLHMAGHPAHMQMQAVVLGNHPAAQAAAAAAMQQQNQQQPQQNAGAGQGGVAAQAAGGAAAQVPAMQLLPPLFMPPPPAHPMMAPAGPAWWEEMMHEAVQLAANHAAAGFGLPAPLLVPGQPAGQPAGLAALQDILHHINNPGQPPQQQQHHHHHHHVHHQVVAATNAGASRPPLGLGLVLPLPRRSSGSALTARWQLRSLDLSRCRLSALPPGLQAAAGSLTSLDISGNALTALPAMLLAGASQLTRLVASSNRISEVSLLADCMPRLLHADLSRNSIMSGSLACVPALTHLNLAHNALKELPDSLHACVGLKTLLLHNNRLSGSLPEAFSCLSHLELLQLGPNLLSLRAIAPQVGSCTRLRSLSMVAVGGRPSDAAQPGGGDAGGGDALPDCLSRLVLMSTLDASSCQLARITPHLSACTALTSLTLSHNKLQALPLELFGLTNLKALLVSRNLLRCLPPDVSRLCRLRQLELSSNALEEVPQELWGLQHLTSLDLQGNALVELPAPLPLDTAATSNSSAGRGGAAASRAALGLPPLLDSLRLQYNLLLGLPPRMLAALMDARLPLRLLELDDRLLSSDQLVRLRSRGVTVMQLHNTAMQEVPVANSPRALHEPAPWFGGQGGPWGGHPLDVGAGFEGAMQELVALHDVDEPPGMVGSSEEEEDDDSDLDLGPEF